MKFLVNLLFYLLLSSNNPVIYSQGTATSYEDYSMTFLKEKYHKELKVRAFKIDKGIFLKESGFEYDKKNGNRYLKLSFLSEKNNYSEKELTRISDRESYESPSFLLFENKNVTNKVFIWKIEGEFFSRMFIYNVDGAVNFLGEITIGKFCEPNCDTFNLTNTDIVVQGNNSNIEITFRGKTFYSTPPIIQSKRGGRIIAENLTLSYFITVFD